ncbi:MAG TPA: NAD-glutamate dehydrogenase [Albitalea sp.]|nr:NAD-glutamate dehydrogenase [Albitalea sp.]
MQQYYAQVAPDDLAERPTADLYGAALSHWHFARQFAAGAPKLRVYNPRLEEHGWQSTHTVIEIVNDDMPFLVDSITMEVNRQGLTMHLIIHPVLRIRRDDQQRIAGLARERSEPEGRLESLVHVEVDRVTEPARLLALHDGLLRILGDVRAAVQDWKPMQQRILDILADIERHPPPSAPGDLAEDRAFLQWLADDNFTLLGCRDYELTQENGDDTLRVVPGSGLGILRDNGQPAVSATFAALPAELRAAAREPRLLVLSKSNARATVHRPGYMDYLGVKRFDDAGRVCGERRLLGLYTSAAYSSNPAEVPLLRRKVAVVTQRAGFLPKSHAAKALVTVLEQYPRDELFQISDDELYTTAMGIARLGERQRTRLFVRRDVFGRFCSCLIYVPRENYNTDLRARMQALLTEVFQGSSSEFSVQFSDSPLARVLIVVRTRAGAVPQVDVREVEQRLVRISRRWEDELKQALLEAAGEERGNALFERYAGGFAAGYREEHAPRVAVHDIEQMETLVEPDALAMSLYVPLEAPPGRLRFKMYRAGQLAPLSQSLPMLEHMGVQVLEERPYDVHRTGPDGARAEIWIDDFGMSVPGRQDQIDVEGLRARFHETFLRSWRGQNENDDFNRLVMVAGLDWREVTVLRAYARYMKQAASTFSQSYIEQALAAHPSIAAELVALFRARFDPADSVDRSGREAQTAARIAAALDKVANLDEDRILRQYLALIEATLRTNFFQRDGSGEPKPVLSFKFDPAKVPQLPEPKPMFEVFVYSPRVEGVHLRGGKVARGGLRWSDRMEDYRTEVLGLVKAQMVKNAVIVPVGSKGGFVLKRPPPAGDREALMKEGVACYQAYLRGLLDLTDNLVSGQVVPPPDLVRHDADDPYLVVAADKGTATFSDIANGVAAEYGFWLGDAFASGGSAGYDHKKMAITARGAWESVMRHFRSLGRDTQSQPFSVVGVGDMSGDVFGNGMLLSRHIRLLAAFDHRHIFIDPNPDAETSFIERERLFALPRSSWADYDATKISAGGGVHPRSAKAIAISPAARAALGIDADSLTPNELMRAILLAPVDLFYNGGIGTYVKSAAETHADVGDRANDAIRVNGAELRCKAVAEGGNLGCTQRGRIEYALRGGLINTDAIDNSAGVDCSDHEVNIKILLNAVVAEGELTARQRDKQLAEMTDEVAQLVLRDNYFQNQVLAVTRARELELIDEQARYLRHLAGAGRLNRRIEFLPTDEAIAERRQAKRGLTAPELAVLLAYSKMELVDLVLDSDVPQDPYIATTLQRYFPKPLRERFAVQLQRHPLKREIIVTHVVNSMVNRVGPTFVHRLHEETGSTQADIVRAYLGAREVFQLISLWLANEALDHKVGVETQDAIVQATVRLLVRGTVWLLHHREALRDLDATIRRFSPGVAEVAAGLARWLAPHERAALQADAARLSSQGVPVELAQRVAQLDALFSALDIVEVGIETGCDVDTVAGVYFGVGGRLDLGWVSQQIAAQAADSHWQGLARVAMRDDLSVLARSLARSVLQAAAPRQDAVTLIAAWESQREFQLRRCRDLLADLKPAGALDMAMLSVLLRELRALI